MAAIAGLLKILLAVTDIDTENTQNMHAINKCQFLMSITVPRQ